VRLIVTLGRDDRTAATGSNTTFLSRVESIWDSLDTNPWQPTDGINWEIKAQANTFLDNERKEEFRSRFRRKYMTDPLGEVHYLR